MVYKIQWATVFHRIYFFCLIIFLNLYAILLPISNCLQYKSSLGVKTTDEIQ